MFLYFFQRILSLIIFLTLQLFLYKILLNCSSAEGWLIFENNCWAMSLLLHCELIKAYESKFFSLFNHETYLILEFFQDFFYFKTNTKSKQRLTAQAWLALSTQQSKMSLTESLMSNHNQLLVTVNKLKMLTSTEQTKTKPASIAK